MKLRVRTRSGRKYWEKWWINMIKSILYETLQELTEIFKN